MNNICGLQPHYNDDPFEQLPDEVLLHLFSFIDSHSQDSLRIVNQRWHRLFLDNVGQAIKKMEEAAQPVFCFFQKEGGANFLNSSFKASFTKLLRENQTTKSHFQVEKNKEKIKELFLQIFFAIPKLKRDSLLLPLLDYPSFFSKSDFALAKIEEIPETFLCPITQELMLNPYKYTVGSKEYVIDKVTLDQCLVPKLGARCPFTLTQITDAKAATDLQKEVYTYLGLSWPHLLS